MAERRMFAKTIIDSDAFLELPISSQLLYFHLSMRADDEGFINKPKTIMRMLGAKDDDMNILIMKKFIIPFESGVVVIKHWRIHNYLQNDRLVPTKYVDEREQLELDENKAYRLSKKPCIHNTGKVYTQVRVVKDSIGKNSIEEISDTLGNLNSTNNLLEENTQSDPLTELIELIESEFKRPTSSYEVEKIKYWFDKVGYNYIIHALRETLIYKKSSVNYLEKVLVRWTNENMTLEMLDNGEHHKK